MAAEPKPLPGIICALFAGSFYGLAPPLVSAATTHGIAALDSTFARTSVLIIIFAIILALHRSIPTIPRDKRPALILQAISTAMISIFYLASVTFIPVGLAVIIFFTFPVMLLLLSPLTEGKSLGSARLAITMLAFIGLIIAIGPGFSTLDPRGIILAALAASGALLQFYSGRKLTATTPPLIFGFLVHLIIWPITMIAALWFGDGSINFISGNGVNSTGYILLLILGLTYIGGYFLHMSSLVYAPASTVAPFFNIEPVVSIVTAAILLGETLTINQYIGGLLVLTALMATALVTRNQKRRITPTTPNY